MITEREVNLRLGTAYLKLVLDDLVARRRWPLRPTTQAPAARAIGATGL